MALSDENGGMVMPVTPYGGANNGFGGDWAWIILLLLLGWGNNGAFGGNGMNGLYPWMNNSNQINGGFRDSMLNDSITEVRTGVTGLASQMAQCCCDNRLATNDLKYTIATENCADRAAFSEGIRDLLTANNANTQRILDQLCADKIDAKNDTIAQLRQELLFARGQASQDVQTATIRASQATTANQLVNELRSCPIPAMPVYGQTPIFNCNNNGGCGCNCGAV